MSDKLKMGRRGRLKALGLGPAALPFAGRFVAEQSLPGVVGLGHVGYNSAGAAGQAAGYTSRWAAVNMLKAAWQAMGRERQDRQRIWQQSMAHRIAGLDPDIFACKSWSHAFAARQQVQRDIRMMDYLSDTGKKLYGWKEEWED